MSESEPNTPLPFFADRFGIDGGGLSAALGTALERPIDFADLFFEYSTQDAVSLEEGIVKSGDRHIEQGVGVRAQSGEKQGYAHSDDVTLESVTLAATTARAISAGSGTTSTVPVGSGTRPVHDLYPVATAPTDVPIERKVDLLSEIDVYARGIDPRVKQVMASALSHIARASASSPPASASPASLCHGSTRLG